MHLLAAAPGAILDGSEAVDLGQTPGDIVVLSAADTELAALSAAHEGAPSLRLANLLRLGHNMSVDLYVEATAARARLAVVRLLGGASYWRYGVERIAARCRERGIALAVLPGDDRPDPELAALCTLPAAACRRLWLYCVHGGAGNFRNFLRYAAHLIGEPAEWEEPAPLARAGAYRAAGAGNGPRAALVFYRALFQAGHLAPVDALAAALGARGLDVLAVWVASLRDPAAADALAALLAESPPDVIVNATGFAVSRPGAPRENAPFDGAAAPVLQAVFAGGTEAAWRAGTHGLSARDIAMNVALPEVDGRILTRAVSFKAEARWDARTECSIVGAAPAADRVEFTAALAAAWTRLRRAPAGGRRIAFVLANYPANDGRVGNGVGLDTPAGLWNALRALRARGYAVADLPENGAALVRRAIAGRRAARYPLERYRAFWTTLPRAVRDAVTERWGAPEDDPAADGGAFHLAIVRYGAAAVGVQPSRGYDIDPARSYHDPDLVPPHGYLAFYAWLREEFHAHAIVHFGKHGNLEWLPGKSLALSRECFPEAALGAVPHVYPFIVNDPGEGSQAKRRAAAVIVDHLTPPMTRAESYGPLAELEQLVDEYYEAAGVDPRRLKLLRGEILDLTRRMGLDRDCGIAPDAAPEEALARLDNHLCELKEMQIRDGLHVFGASPEGARRTDLLAALARLPRGAGESLPRAIAADLGLGEFDPLDCDMAGAWRGPRPAALAAASGDRWRSNGDTVERVELLARSLIEGRAAAPGPAAAAVLDEIATRLGPAVDACGEAEIAGLLAGLDGRFVAPGPSGAPTRGRPEVLPTGRNFYSVDTRAVPTPAAWRLGWRSADMLLARHRQEHGRWPAALAISAWGTANMRTGGDDIAQALALLGARPTWDAASRRVTGFEILPAETLGRPRVDVMFRVSGFFRDAFPAQIDLLDSAVRAVAALDEPEAVNPLAARVRAAAAGAEDAQAAAREASYRVFGSKPGAYGAGLQAPIDAKGWETDADLARAYLAWGGYAYGAGAEGAAAHGLFADRLRAVEGIVQNQDNREHDLLDSDDYYQFEGGMAAAARYLSGRAPAMWHNDHSRPERPRIRSLREEIGRVVRARVVNPKWIAGVMRHGYKGAFEIAATVDYLFAFAATARAVSNEHFDAVYEAYVEDEAVRAFMRGANPQAARDTAARLLEAQRRGLWQPRANSAPDRLAELAAAPDETDAA